MAGCFSNAAAAAFGSRLQVRGSMSARHRSGAQPQDGAGGREEGKGRGQDAIARLNAGCRHGQPQRVRSRATAYGLGHSAVPGGGLLKLATSGPRTKRWLQKTASTAAITLGTDLGIFPGEIEQGNGRGAGSPEAAEDGSRRGNVVHRGHQRSLSQPRAYFLHPTHVSDRSSVPDANFGGWFRQVLTF